MVYKEDLIQQMDKLEDLLPGIEDYLCNVLANEKLSEHAEERRQYFLERLDIIKLPPSVPPRPQSLGVPLLPDKSSPTSSDRTSVHSLDVDDFAAYQREIARAHIGSQSSLNETEVKVYDDIDIADGSTNEIRPTTAEEESMYEIPQGQRTLNDSGYDRALELSPSSKSASSDEQLSGSAPPAPPLPPTLPPPLPPRGERTASDTPSRGSVGSILDGKVSDLVPQKLPLTREYSAPLSPARTPDLRGKASSEDLNGEECDKMSCESVDGISRSLAKDDSIKLPRPVKRRQVNLQRKLGKSLSSLLEVSQPYSMLEDIVLSGELYYKSTLTWTKKIVALTNGRLVCYKVDKTDSRPSFVVMLLGYTATVKKREGKQNFEIHLDHENFESYIFMVDFKDWAEMWCQHINAASKGMRAPGPLVHLARGSLLARHDSNSHLTNSNQQLSTSASSLASVDGVDGDPGTVKVRKRDPTGTKTAKMGQFAFRATQFFESLGKKGSIKKPLGPGAEGNLPSERDRGRLSSWPPSSTASTPDKLSPLTSSSEKLSASTPGSDIPESPLESPVQLEKHIKHQGYLDIYSSFNKRKWGKRWCLVHENNFECYRTQKSDVCELEFLLKKCILRRAIQETKSELGLMLMENNREKITIEPRSWNDLGSWLRILMQETSTPKTPEGLEGYMDDTHPYHEAVEITNKLQVPTKTAGPVADKAKSKMETSNRDSGICAKEKAGGAADSLGSPVVNVCFSSSSLPRVSVGESGDIYTQVRKCSVTSVQSTETLTSPVPSKQSEISTTQNKSQQEHKNPENIKKVGPEEVDDDKIFLDFDSDTLGEHVLRREESLVDEIMSHLKNQRDSASSDLTEPDIDTTIQTNTATKRKSPEFIEFSADLSPIKADNTDLTCNTEIFCSSFIEDDETQTGADLPAKVPSVDGENGQESSCVFKESPASKYTIAPSRSSSGRNSRQIDDTLAELRTRLVQLKKDRIAIRDRKQKCTSETNRQFLEAEYDRLDRECHKVAEEIRTIEIPELEEDNVENCNKQQEIESDLVKSELNESEVLEHKVPQNMSEKVDADTGCDSDKYLPEKRICDNEEGMHRPCQNGEGSAVIVDIEKCAGEAIDPDVQQ